MEETEREAQQVKLIQGFYYKVGRHGFVFRLSNGEWVKSSMTQKQFHKSQVPKRSKGAQTYADRYKGVCE